MQSGALIGQFLCLQAGGTGLYLSDCGESHSPGTKCRAEKEGLREGNTGLWIVCRVMGQTYK